jgi:PAS domain S-box-containing protein
MTLMTPHGPTTPHVLIVDDQPRNLDALEAMLAPLDCELIRAMSANEALLALLQREFAAIVLDIRMPGMDGIELAKLIKQRRRSRHIPILFLTAHTVDENDVLQGYGVGAVDYLSKPVNAEILRSKIGVFIDLFTKTRALAHVNERLQTEMANRERAQIALEAANRDLERRVQERTAALMRAHQGVRENEERLRMALEVARIAAWEWDFASGRMTWSTDPEALFGFPSGSFGSELRLVRIAHPDDRPIIDEAVATALERGTYEAEYRLLRSDGSVAWITERGCVVREEHHGWHRMVGISRDVTADRQAAIERERLLGDARAARDEVERQSRLKDEFLASLSHELRTPMNVILGWLATLESGKPVREVHSALAIVRRNAELQAKLIDDLLDMNRLISGNVPLEIGPVDMAALLHTTVQGLQPAADGRGVQLMWSVPTDLGPVTGDARRLQQVLWNLAHNAVKFTPRGGRVEIRMEQVAGAVEISVHDTGRGISAAFLPYVFERFRQEDASSSAEATGLGLGLAIAKELVELHGGNIRVSSAGPGTGATFVVQVPLEETATRTCHPAAERGAFPASV